VVTAAVEGTSGRPAIAVTGQADGSFTVRVTGAADPHDAGALDRWSRRARALGGDLERHPDGVTLRLPMRLPAHLPGERPSRHAIPRPFTRTSRLPSRSSVASSSGALS
jgi:hypothetical protein